MGFLIVKIELLVALSVWIAFLYHILVRICDPLKPSASRIFCFISEQMCQVANTGDQQLASDHVTAEDERAQARMLAFQCLDSCQFVSAHGMLSLLSQFRGLLIQCANCCNGLFSQRIGWRCQPIPNQVWLDIPFFKSREAWRGEICGMMSRAMTSSAISRPVHWLIGRSLGCSHASAIN